MKWAPPKRWISNFGLDEKLDHQFCAEFRGDYDGGIFKGQKPNLDPFIGPDCQKIKIHNFYWEQKGQFCLKLAMFAPKKSDINYKKPKNWLLPLTGESLLAFCFLVFYEYDLAFTWELERTLF